MCPKKSHGKLFCFLIPSIVGSNTFLVFTSLFICWANFIISVIQHKYLGSQQGAAIAVISGNYPDCMYHLHNSFDRKNPIQCYNSASHRIKNFTFRWPVQPHFIQFVLSVQMAASYIMDLVMQIHGVIWPHVPCQNMLLGATVDCSYPRYIFTSNSICPSPLAPTGCHMTCT